MLFLSQNQRQNKMLEFKETPPGGEIQTKTAAARVEVKGEGDGGILHIKAYALAFGNVDSWGDIIMPGACDEFLAGPNADRMALCWQHDRATVIGKITDKGTDDYGLWIEADILPTTTGNDAAILLKNGAVKEFSIGYRAVKYHWEHKEGYEYDIRILEAIEIVEVSPVTTAANPAAILISAKADPEHNQKPIQSINQTPSMTPEEIKEMQDRIEKAATEKVTAEIKSLQDKLTEAKSDTEAKEKEIENLDKSVKSLKAEIEKLGKERVITDFKSAFRAALEEKRDDIKAAFDAKKNSFDINVELKTVYDIGTSLVNPNGFTSIQADPTIHAAAPVANAFIVAFGLRPRTANKLGWIEATAQNGADYVAELAQNNKKSDVAFAEKTRLFGKIAHTMRISTEFEDWFEQLYNYCVNEGVRMILNKLDQEIYDGAGADSGAGTSPSKIYGLKSQATAFSALGTYTDATVADVIFDAAMQIAKEGYNANVAFVTWAIYAQLRGIKDANGNYIFDQARNLLGGIRIYPSGRLSSGEILVADTTCVEIYAGNSYELEFIRNGVYDAYDVYFRRAAQVKVSTPNKKGLIYVAAAATSQAAINTPGSIATIAGTVDNGAIKTKAASA